MTAPGDDIKEQMLNMIKTLSSDELASLNEAIRDALMTAARGEPSNFPINEMVHIPQDEAQRICRKIGLDWETGDMKR